MLRLAWLSSRRAPGLEYLLERRGGDFELAAGIVTERDGEALPLLRRAGVPALLHDIGAFGRGRTRRTAFDAVTRDLLAPHHPDVLVLSGYLYVVTEPLLAAFPGRILNVHDADLALRGPDGRPRYPGLHATRDALRAGEAVTRCSVHVVTADVDAGPVLVRSVPFPVQGRHHFVQRAWMMQAAWGPLIARAAQLLSEKNRRGDTSRKSVEEKRTAWIA